MPRLQLALAFALAIGVGCASSDDSTTGSMNAHKTTQAKQPPPSKAAAPSPSPKDTAELPVVVFETDAGPARVSVEVVRRPTELARGLMYRRHLPWDRGMLFVFPEEEQQSFWMKNTLIPLDMIFVKSDMTVLGVVHKAEPKTTKPRRVPGLSQFVVETNGGWAKKHGVTAGTKVTFERVEP